MILSLQDAKRICLYQPQVLGCVYCNGCVIHDFCKENFKTPPRAWVLTDYEPITVAKEEYLALANRIPKDFIKERKNESDLHETRV